MFDSFTKNNGSDPVTEGMLIGSIEKANQAESEAKGWKRKAEEWEDYAHKLERKIANISGERDAGVQTITAIMNEISEIKKDPNKPAFFSDPENRLSRTNFFKEIAGKRTSELIEKNKLPKDSIID